MKVTTEMVQLGQLAHRLTIEQSAWLTDTEMQRLLESAMRAAEVVTIPTELLVRVSTTLWNNGHHALSHELDRAIAALGGEK